MSPLLTLRQNVPAPNRRRRVGPAPNCSNAELAAPNWHRRIGGVESSHFDVQCVYVCSVLFFSCPRSESWPHHGRAFSIYLCPLSFWLTIPWRVLSTSWCCPSRPCVVFLACVHLALSPSSGNSLISSWCDHSMLASLLWRCLTVPSLLQLSCLQNLQNLSESFHLEGVKMCFFIFSESPAFTAIRCTMPH